MEDYQFKCNGKGINSNVVHQAQTGYEMFGPYCIAIIELEEGPRITSQVVDCEPEIVKPGMKVKSVLRKLGEDSDSGILHYGTKFILDEVLQTGNDEDDDIADVEL